LTRPGSIEVCFPTTADHSRTDVPLVAVINFHTQLYPGPASNKVLHDFGDTERDRLNYFQQALERVVDERPRVESIALPKNFGCGLAGGRQEAYLTIINRWAAANPGIQVYLVTYGADLRTASPQRTPARDRDRDDRSRGSPRRSQSPSRRSGPAREHPHGGPQMSRRTYAGSAAESSHVERHASPARTRDTGPTSATSVASASAMSAVPRPMQVCRYVQQGQQCPFERRPGGCKFEHLTERQPSIAARASRAHASEGRPTFSFLPNVPLLNLSISRITELPYALGTKAGPDIDPRQAGVEYLRQYSPWQNQTPGWEPVDELFVVFDWGAKSFSAGEAVRCTRHGLYLACDLFDPGDARVQEMLRRHNQQGVRRAAYMQGHPGRAPTEQELEVELRRAFGVRLESIRVLLASPNCQTVSSARGPVYIDRDATLRPTSTRAIADDAARDSIMSLSERLRNICLLFTAVIEQPRTGIALEVHDIKQRLLFKHWYVNTVDHCQFSLLPWPMKPTLLLSLGDFSPMNVTCRDGSSCAWKLPSGQHQLSIVDYNCSLQQRLADDDIRRDAIPVHETAAIIANALKTQDAQQQHACSDQQPSSRPSQQEPSMVYTARLAGRIPRLDKVALTAQKLHQACLHVAPQRILDSIPGWTDFRLTAANGRILSGSDVRLSDLQIDGTCHECIRGRSDAPPSRHSAQQVAAKRAALRREDVRPDTARSYSPPSSRSSSPARRSARVQDRQIA
jgi:hypothetical protein